MVFVGVQKQLRLATFNKASLGKITKARIKWFLTVRRASKG